MLVLTRKQSQEVCIGPLVVVRLIAVQGEQVRLGIDAPNEVRIMRRELVTAGAVLLTPREREDEMRDEGSRRFVQRPYEPPRVTDLGSMGSVPSLDALFAA